MNTTLRHDYAQLANYELIEKIGEGGYGFVFKARQLSTGQIVAIKMLRNQDAIDDSARKHQRARFERETQLCAEINHPHIVRLLDKGFSSNKEPFAAFEFVEGQTLKDLILEKNGLTAVETGVLMGQVLDALVSAHTAGIIHRDLKPHNIMVTQTGARPYVKVLDFGIGAFASGFRSNDYRSLTLTQEVVGTPAYCAPEQLRGEPSTPRSDLYSWGLIVLECLTGQPVVQGSGVSELFQQQLNAANVPLPSTVAGHPLADLLRKVLEKNPRSRISDSNKLLAEFSGINFNTLVGTLRTSATALDESDDATLASPIAWKATQSEKRQLTILSLKLDLLVEEGAVLDLETLDTIKRDQVNLCSDTAIRFGGYIAGTLSNQIMVFFGYPNVSDNDARRAGRTVLELISEVKKRSALLYDQHRIQLEIRSGIHTGTVLVTGSEMPIGMATDAVFQLLYSTPSNQVWVSESAKKLLDPFLMFDEAPAHQFKATELIKAYVLTGERQTEALSFLRPRSASQQMVGRTNEKALLIRLWEQVAKESGKAALVRGEAGIGKSRLIYEIKRYARDENILVRESRCFPEYQNNALYPFFEILKKSIGIVGADNMELAAQRLEQALMQSPLDALETLLPIYCSWLSIPLPAGYQIPEIPPAEQKLRLMNSLEKLLITTDSGQPMILIIEDLHWMDPTSREFIEQLLGHLDQSACLMLMTARPEFEPQWSEEQVQSVQLQELCHSDAHVLIQNILGEGTASEQALEYITNRTDGIPLFIEELTHMLLDRNYLKLEEKHYELIEGLEEKRVPMSVKDLLQARLDNLGLAKETAQIAATIGREFDYELLVQSSLRDEAMVQSDLEQLLNSDLIFRQRRVEGEHYVFRHALIADATYDSMTTSNRKEVHGRVAQAIEEGFPNIKVETPFVLARHFGEAQAYANAISYGRIAAERTLKQSLNEEVLNISGHVIKWIESDEDTYDAIDELNIRCVEANALMTKFGWAADVVKTSVDKAFDIMQTLGSSRIPTKELISSYWILFTYYHVASERDRVKVLSKELLALAQGTDDLVLETSANTIEGIRMYVDGEFEEAIKVLSETLDRAKANYDDTEVNLVIGIDDLAYASSMLGQTLWFIGKKTEGRMHADWSIERARQIDHIPSYCLSLMYRIAIHQFDGEKEAVQAKIDELLNTAGKYGMGAYIPYAMMYKYWAFDEVEPIDEMINQLEAMGCKIALTQYKSFPAVYEFENGMKAKAIKRIDDCLALCDELKEYYFQGYLRQLKEKFTTS